MDARPEGRPSGRAAPAPTYYDRVRAYRGGEAFSAYSNEANATTP